MAKTPKRPRDANQLAKLIVDMATGEAPSHTTVDGKDPAAVALGRKGGLKGGKARAEKLSAARRTEIAKKAALAKWRR
jgi:hypothetical protein